MINDFYRVLTTIKKFKNTRFALATVIGVEGSAYRHTGAKMLIGENGEQYGTISAGCLEEDLTYHAQNILKTLQPKNFTYDLRSEDDLSWGQGAGCNGKVKVYVEPTEWEYIPSFHHLPFWPQVDCELQLGYKVAIARSLKEENKGRNYLSYSESGVVFGEADHGVKDVIFAELVTFINSGEKIKVISFPEPFGEFLLELLEPRENLIIFGAGPDVEPLARHAAALDFSVTIIDPRSERCNRRNFPTVDHLIVEHPESYLKKNQISSNSFVLIMTHSFQRDSHILNELILCRPRYLGALGPRRRTERLLSSHSLPEWVYSPVGLNIHAEGPEEIAISIVAQLLQVRNETKKALCPEKVKI